MKKNIRIQRKFKEKCFFLNTKKKIKKKTHKIIKFFSQN